ncbi:MAG TPA: hypothetical protein VN673_13475 [Clostridia bacterium]|nr:hypothetical protein [Clostridia bacterium]
MIAVTLNPAEEQATLNEIRRLFRKLASSKVLAGDPVAIATLTEKAFRQEFPVVAKNDNRLANAIARGMTARQKLVQAEGGSLSAEAAAERLGITKPAILKRYQKGRLVAFREEKQNAVRFPVWQFKDDRVMDGLEEVLQVLNAGAPLDDFGRLLFFLSTPSLLGGKRPLDCLREGKPGPALQAAHAYAA